MANYYGVGKTNSKGESRMIDIGHITKLAEEIGSNF
jgi:hypothetical protein